MTEKEFDEMTTKMKDLDEEDEIGETLRDYLPLLKRAYGCPRSEEEEEKLERLDRIHEKAMQTEA